MWWTEDVRWPTARVRRVTREPRAFLEEAGVADVWSSGECDVLLTVCDEEEPIDLGEKGETPDVYWAEGWTFSSLISAARSNHTWHDGKLVRSLATRYRLWGEKLSRGHKRVLSKNADLSVVVRPLRITPVKEALNAVHVYSRFKEKAASLAKTWEYIVHYPSSLHEQVVFSPEGEMIALTIIEVGERASYVTKTVWHPGHAKRSLGTFALLKAFEYSRSRWCYHTYVGPTILADPNFNYKLRYPGAELYRVESNEWFDARSEEGKALLTEPFETRLWNPMTHKFVD